MIIMILMVTMLSMVIMVIFLSYFEVDCDDLAAQHGHKDGMDQLPFII